jgi:hypothetical protein
MPSFVVTHSSYLNPIGDSVGAALGRLIWSHLVTEGCLRDAVHDR